MNYSSILIFLGGILLGLFLYYLYDSLLFKKEGLDFSFNNLWTAPVITVDKSYTIPYCTSESGYPLACHPPMDNKYDYPVPALSNKAGAYTPSKFCPGPPLC